MSRFHAMLVSDICTNRQAQIYRTALANASGPKIEFILQLFIKTKLIDQFEYINIP